MHGTPDLRTAQARIHAQKPATPAPGPLEHIAGLLVSRAAPLDPTRQQQLLTRLGLPPATNTTATCPGPASTSVRLRTLARATGVPPALDQAVHIYVTHPTRRAGQALRDAGLTRSDDDVDPVQLVQRLRDLYGMAAAALDNLDPVGRRQWKASASQARRRGALVLPDELLVTAATVLPWLSTTGLAIDDACLVRRDDSVSRLSLLVHRQLAVAGCSPLHQLAQGVRRAQPELHPPGTDLADLIRRWAQHQPSLDIAVGALALEPATTGAQRWSTRADLVVIQTCGAAGAQCGDLLRALMAAGRTAGGAQQVVWRSPILRPSGRRGFHVLVGTTFDR